MHAAFFPLMWNLYFVWLVYIEVQSMLILIPFISTVVAVLEWKCMFLKMEMQKLIW